MLPPPDAQGAGDSRLARNTLWLMSGEVISKFASIVLVVIVARAIGVREYGYFSFAGSFVPLFLIVGALGVHQMVVRRIVEDPVRTSEVYASGLLVRVLAGLLGLGTAVALAPLFLSDPEAIMTVLVVGTALLLDTVTSYLSALFEAFERNRYYATALVVNRVGSTSLAIVVYLAGGGLTAILVTYLLGSLAALVYALRSVRRHFPEIRLRSARWRTGVDLVREGAALGVAGILNMALFRLDTIMIAAYLSAEAVGLYGVAFRFLESFLFVSFALADAFFPRYARQGPGQQTAQTVHVVTTVALTFYLPLLVLSLAAAPWLVTTVFGDRYAEAAPAVPWLTLAAVLYAVTYQCRTAAVAVGGRSSIAAIAAVALVVNVALNAFLIPRYGITGAAIGTASASALEAVLSVIALRRRGVLVGLPRLVLPPVLAAGATAVLLRLTGLDDGWALVVGGAAYLALLLVAGRALVPADAARAVTLLRSLTSRKPTSA